MTNRIVAATRQIRLSDVLAPFCFIILLIPSFVFRMINHLKGRKLWLIAEQGEARDNGYYFFKYVRKKHPSDYCFYAIKADNAKYDEVRKLGNVIRWGSLKHWLYYMSANLNISSQKSGNPCPMFWYIMHVTLGLYRNRVFLQHGVIKDDLKFAYYNCCKFRFFVCGAKREYDFITAKFGYPKKNLILTGLPRWDDLKDTSRHEGYRSILIMPTWRQWLGSEKGTTLKISGFRKTTYYKHWNGLLSNHDFISFIEKNNITVYFYPHINMQQFISEFKPSSEQIKIVSPDQEIQSFFNKSSLMITDYTSAVFDFAYLNKPIIYYQFDIEEYRRKQHPEGYFKYEEDGFGPITTTERETISKVKNYARCDYENEQKYVSRVKSFFTLHDHKNCERVYEEIK